MDARAVAHLRAQFPILAQKVHGKPLVYLDNAATTQKPQVVIDAITRYYTTTNANIHRGVHTLSQQATEQYEAVRQVVARLLGVRDAHEIVYVRGATEAINLVAHSWGRANVGPGDEVLITGMEHHSNIVPWQLLVQAVGASLKVIPITDSGELVADWQSYFTPRTKIVACVHISNALGTVNAVAEICAYARARGVASLVDGAQAVAHTLVDVASIGCDFYVFSGHKVYGPTGIGVLWGRRALLDAMPPWQGGGDMIRSVTFEKSTYNDLPHKFEAGTPNIADTIALGVALEWFMALDRPALFAHEERLRELAEQQLTDLGPSIRLIGTAGHKSAVTSYVIAGLHPHDIGTILDHEGVAIRAGHHCVQPVMDRFGIPATARASFACYSTESEVEALVSATRKAAELFGVL